MTQDYLNSPEMVEIYKKQVEIDNEILRRIVKNNFFAFVKYFWDVTISDPFVYNWHIRYICNEMQKVGKWVINREPAKYDLVINVPPGTSKTTICTIMFPAWLWCNAAWVRIISGSYAMELGIEQSIKSRDILKSDKFKNLFPGLVNFKGDQDNKKLYQNTDNGSRMTTSTGGTVTGRHGHIIPLDDLIDPNGAASEVERNKANVWLSGTIPSRKINKENTPLILIGQRLHQFDPTGFLEDKAKNEGKKIKVIRLPADDSLCNIKPSKLKYMYKDGLLDPNRLSRKVLNAAKIDLGSNEYTGQFLQSPIAEGGNIIKREWIQDFSGTHKRRPMTIIQSWDTAFKKGKENAHNVCTTWHEHPEGYYLIDAFIKKLTYPELKQEVVAQEAKHDPDKVLVEDKATGTPIIQELSNNTRINFVPIMPEGDKIARAHSISPTFEAKNVYILINAEWSSLLIEQITMFPNCKILDIMDSVSQYINYMRSKSNYSLSGLLVKSPKSTKGYRYG